MDCNIPAIQLLYPTSSDKQARAAKYRFTLDGQTLLDPELIDSSKILADMLAKGAFMSGVGTAIGLAKSAAPFYDVSIQMPAATIYHSLKRRHF